MGEEQPRESADQYRRFPSEVHKHNTVLNPPFKSSIYAAEISVHFSDSRVSPNISLPAELAQLYLEVGCEQADYHLKVSQASNPRPTPAG